MKLIVDISPEDYEYLKSYREFYDTSEGRILKAVCNGKDAMAVIAEVTATVFEELNLEIDEMFARRIDYTVDKIQDLIQEKINSLKEVKDGK